MLNNSMKNMNLQNKIKQGNILDKLYQDRY